jgi:hypothetical protein
MARPRWGVSLVGGGSCPQSPQIDPLSRLSGLDVYHVALVLAEISSMESTVYTDGDVPEVRAAAAATFEPSPSL